jgi:hypothetical protein
MTESETDCTCEACVLFLYETGRRRGGCPHAGFVEATIKRDASGAIETVTLPGYGWE